jgi:hypothetical protein
MTEMQPIHALRARLEAARLQEVEALAAAEGEPNAEGLKTIAHLQAALTAVREEIRAHAVKIGGGSEEALE